MTKRRRNVLWAIRMIFLGLWFAIASLILLVVSLFRPQEPLNNRLYTQLLAPVGRRILGLQVESRGFDGSTFAHPAVLIMNHQAALDILLNADFYPARCVVIAKRSLALIPVFGWVFYLSGNILLNRTDRRQSISMLNKALEVIAQKKWSVWLFPEGTRSRERGLGRFKKGAFHLVIQAQVPLIPIVSSSYVGKLDFGRWHAGKIIVQVLPSVETGGLQSSDLTSLMEKTETTMREAIALLDEEIRNQEVPT